MAPFVGLLVLNVNRANLESTNAALRQQAVPFRAYNSIRQQDRGLTLMLQKSGVTPHQLRLNGSWNPQDLPGCCTSQTVVGPGDFWLPSTVVIDVKKWFSALRIPRYVGRYVGRSVWFFSSILGEAVLDFLGPWNHRFTHTFWRFIYTRLAAFLLRPIDSISLQKGSHPWDPTVGYICLHVVDVHGIRTIRS